MKDNVIDVVLEQTKEANRLEKLYQETYEKYDTKINKLTSKRDADLLIIWKSLCKEKNKLEKLKDKLEKLTTHRRSNAI
tara:strand:- start:28 stop:264 length:237 start_codon:yes stop_codon:yes gene_type:complete